MAQLLIPPMGEGTTEVVIIQLLKQVGDHVKRDEPVYEMETDKAAFTIESDVEGILEKWLAAENDIIPVGSPIAVIRAVGEMAEPSSVSEALTPQPEKMERVAEEVEKIEKVEAAPEVSAPPARIPPKTRQYAQEHQIEPHILSQLAEKHGTLLPGHIDDYLQQYRETKISEETRPSEKSNAENDNVGFLSRDQQRLNRAIRLNSATVQPCWAAKPLPIELVDNAIHHLTETSGQQEWITPFQVITYAISQALKKFPMLRSRPLDQERYHTYTDINLGIAFLDEKGDLSSLKVPGTQTMSFFEFRQQLNGVLDPDVEKLPVDIDVPMMISYTGNDGATFAVPVIVPPSQSTLFIGAPHNKEMNLVLAFNHYLLNGVEASEFITEIITQVRVLSGPRSTAHQIEGKSGKSVSGQLRTLLADFLNWDEDFTESMMQRTWADLGIDSLKAVKLAELMSAHFRRKLSPTLFWRYSSPHRLIEYLDVSKTELTENKHSLDDFINAMRSLDGEAALRLQRLIEGGKHG
ncbi:biotin/lipoyl-containing protein [Photorhabdus bodei]|uniref:Dihydrolipoamide acetyltransferase component of pyruvate dehydrogenase complex n=1 Tax=Photorhabdus bodei TaxID=2029681 RepID=A0A329X8U1_9GAMM|nr:biotin/lipoyl-containing protein [Photorhabdus bodei]NDK98332.1 branched-chain alpha-keto acid dehydrogenase subunit E2 [Photorhabdus bodei]NDL02583.1 branched-chain alpha-keto acid dehydrogenase subunit E2 [Photorhabdus bodei]NDL06657.1 branched-chain alpha-keto acid dehydrogenase subunit E2 [Photorhabdus bodei]RAX12976.1 branched-chain alpha-keto acid dehydrogenase subunit E2 [Photorhabdus bodei]